MSARAIRFRISLCMPWALALGCAALGGCMARKAAHLDAPLTPATRCHQEQLNPDCTTTVNLACTPPPMPGSPDPRAFKVAAGPPLELGIADAVQLALDNSPIAKVQRGARDLDAAGTAFDPRIADAQRYATLGIFDTVVGGNLLLPHERNPPGTSFNGFGTRPTRLNRGDFDLYASQLFKRGGTATITHSVDYLHVPGAPTLINPQYQSHLEFSLTQPLLRNAGARVTTAPIAIAASQANQSVWEFKRKLLAMARGVEVAYWELDAARRNVAAIDEALPQLEMIVTVLTDRVAAERGVPAQLSRAKTLYYELQSQRIATVRLAREKEQLLRNYLQLPPGDGRPIRLLDAPFRAPVTFDWDELVQVAIEQRPEIVRQRLAVHIAELQWSVANNSLLPQLDAYAAARMNGLDDELGSSWGMMASGAHTDWNLGVIVEVPWQRTKARGDVRAAELQIRRDRSLLDQLGHQITHELSNVLRDLDAIMEEREVAEKRLEASGEWVTAAAARFRAPSEAREVDQSFDRYLRSIQSRLTAATGAISLIERYNSALVILEETRGTLLETRAVYIAGDPTSEANAKTSALLPLPTHGAPELDDDSKPENEQLPAKPPAKKAPERLPQPLDQAVARPQPAEGASRAVSSPAAIVANPRPQDSPPPQASGSRPRVVPLPAPNEAFEPPARADRAGLAAEHDRAELQRDRVEREGERRGESAGLAAGRAEPARREPKASTGPFESPDSESPDSRQAPSRSPAPRPEETSIAAPEEGPATMPQGFNLPTDEPQVSTPQAAPPHVSVSQPATTPAERPLAAPVTVAAPQRPSRTLTTPPQAAPQPVSRPLATPPSDAVPSDALPPDTPTLATPPPSASPTGVARPLAEPVTIAAPERPSRTEATPRRAAPQPVSRPLATPPSDALPSDAVPSDAVPSDAVPSDALPPDTPTLATPQRAATPTGVARPLAAPVTIAAPKRPSRTLATPPQAAPRPVSRPQAAEPRSATPSRVERPLAAPVTIAAPERPSSHSENDAVATGPAEAAAAPGRGIRRLLQRGASQSTGISTPSSSWTPQSMQPPPPVHF